MVYFEIEIHTINTKKKDLKKYLLPFKVSIITTIAAAVAVIALRVVVPSAVIKPQADGHLR